MADVIHHLTKKYGITGELVVRPCVYVVDGCRAVRPTNDGEAPEFYGVYERKPDGHGGEYEEWVADFNEESHANLFAKSPKMLALLDVSDIEAAHDKLSDLIEDDETDSRIVIAATAEFLVLLNDWHEKRRALLSELEVKR